VNLQNQKKKNFVPEHDGRNKQPRSGVVSIPVRLPLEGCMGQREIGTDNVHPDDLSIGLLDLL
jgi:hypothetical protein